MRRPGHGAFTGSALLLALFFGHLAGAAGHVTVNDRHGLIDVHAAGLPVRDVLAAIAAERNIEIRSFQQLEHAINLRSGPTTLHGVLRRLLRDESFVLQESGSPGIASRLTILADDAGTGPVAWQTTGRRNAALDRLRLDMSAPDVDTRLEAVLDLADIGTDIGKDIDDRTAMEILTQSLQDPSDEVRDAATAALEDIQSLAATD